MHEESKKANRLINEKSPYLLQHAYNPVDWFPWGKEAFKKAKAEDKPIFLSIGYSTCHWCHVMEDESFEDSTVASIMNEYFVSIKVDREERPDIDNIYMTVCQMMTGHGGWPLTIIMTPERKPFFAGTYFPKESRYGRMGLIDLLNKIKEVWRNKRKEVLSSADKISDYLAENVSVKTEGIIDESILNKAFAEFSSRYDNEYGGFGSIPKFPSPHNLLYLLRYWHGAGKAEALEMVKHTLSQMRLGGLFDHIGGGFHRYSTDRKWLLPHFEKMLYDQGMLTFAYTEAYSATGKTEFKKTAEEIVRYVLRDMTSPEGGFYSAEDADSDGKEGKFYVWTTEEIKKILGEKDAELFIEIFNLEDEGNFVDESAKRKTGANILYLKKPLADIASELRVNNKDFVERIERIKRELFNKRKERISPYKDDKILTDWNGLMIASLAYSGRTFNNKDYIEAAEKAFRFIENNLYSKGKLFHRYRDGESGLTGTLDDYAYVVWGLIELYESTFNIDYLEKAIYLNDVIIEDFHDSRNGGFFLTSENAEKLLIRPKDFYDGAIPSGNSAAYYNLIRLYKFTANDKYMNYITEAERLFSEKVMQAPTSFSMFLSAYSGNIYGAPEIVIVEGKNGDDDYTLALNKLFLPNKSVLLIPNKGEKEKLYSIAGFTKDHTTINGLTTGYVCRNFVCNLPVTDVKEMIEQIKRLESGKNH